MKANSVLSEHEEDLASDSMPELPPNYDPARAEHIRELWAAMHASHDPLEQARLWDELGEYILGLSTSQYI
jgi:hypothetical protein